MICQSKRLSLITCIIVVCQPKCINGGQCVLSKDDGDKNVCECPRGFAGDHCQLTSKNVKAEKYDFSKDNIKTHNSMLENGRIGEMLVLNGPNSYAIMGTSVIILNLLCATHVFLRACSQLA